MFPYGTSIAAGSLMLSVSCQMSRIQANAIRVPVGVIALFGAYLLGTTLGGIIRPESFGINKMETVATKVGASLVIVVTSFVLERFLFRSLEVAFLCLAATEAAVLFIILKITGLPLTNLSDIAFNLGWLYSITWNVAVAFSVGTVLGHLCHRLAANKSLHSTPR